MPGCLNLAKTFRASTVVVGLISFGITTVMAAPAAVKSKTVPTKVEIFTTDAFPVTGVEELRRLVGEKNVVVYALDGVDKVEKEFPIVGARSEAEVSILGRKLLNANRKEIAPRVYASFNGLYYAAFSYQITKYPAIIFDQRFVAYGENDAAKAMKTLLNRPEYRRGL